MGQICEFFGQIAEGKITSEAIQELIEHPSKIALARIFKDTITRARSSALEIYSDDLRAKTLKTIANISKNAEDFDPTLESTLETWYGQMRAEGMSEVADALADGDFTLARKLALRCGDSYDRNLMPSGFLRKARGVKAIVDKVVAIIESSGQIYKSSPGICYNQLLTKGLIGVAEALAGKDFSLVRKLIAEIDGDCLRRTESLIAIAEALAITMRY